MFKVGDVVKCIDAPYGSFRLTNGKTYVVQKVRDCYNTGGGKAGDWVEVIGDDNVSWGFYSMRFELADPSASTSDQQLADDFRNAYRCYWELVDELTDRGYTLMVHTKYIQRYSTKTGEFPEIRIQKEKKELISL